MLLTAIERRARSSRTIDAPDSAGSAFTHLLWFCDGVLVFFGVSLFFSGILGLDNDLYYAVFCWCALTFLYRYVCLTQTDVVAALRVRRRSSMFVGLLTAIYIVVAVGNAEPTERPVGSLLLAELLWRGLVYGAVTSLVLTAFPMAVSYGVLEGKLYGVGRRFAFGALTLVLVWTMTSAYHVGFAQFDLGGRVRPQLGPTVASLPAVITANPIGSIGAQTALHVAATYRIFESEVLIPPQVDVPPGYEPPGLFDQE